MGVRVEKLTFARCTGGTGDGSGSGWENTGAEGGR